ncbi:MAG: RHS repeat-associated core domain-containing protein, partial [Anaerolineae bacterium]
GRLSEIRYKPWGESRYTFGATPTQRRFTGQVLDEVAGGLYFYNARYYDPALGRFAQADTLIPQPQNPQSLNRYAYAANNPILFTDQQGQSPTCALCVSTMMIQAHVWNPLFGTGPDRDGLRVAQDHQDLINDYATADAPAIALAAGIAVQSQWMIQDVLGQYKDADPSLGITQLRRSHLNGGDPRDPNQAVPAFAKMIGAAVAACTECSTTDKFVVAALAQNQVIGADWVTKVLAKSRDNGQINWGNHIAQLPGVQDVRGPWLSLRAGGRPWTLFQVQLFLNDLQALIEAGWEAPPDLNIGYLQCLASGAENCSQ